ncbi:MAG: hypothetical protein KDC74_09250 [Flavobacteriaceae bacterium]|nr:hypothetical protein [Flavobacteriaceae bacterium]MCB0485258.1 hypothetical protein [Flavobacteriaceae bacterium]
MKKYFVSSIVIFLFLSNISIHCQVSNNQQILNDRNTVTSVDLRSKKLEGSPYINKIFLPAKLETDGNIYSMKYNAYQDEMEVEKDGKQFNLIKKINHKITFLNDNKIYSPYSFKENNEYKVGFFVVLLEDKKISLFLKEKVKLYDEVKPKTGYEKYQPPKLKRMDDSFYISYDSKIAVQVPKKKKEILALFSGKADDVESYAKKNKLGFNKKDDLIKICTYYSTL